MRRTRGPALRALLALVIASHLPACAPTERRGDGEGPVGAAARLAEEGFARVIASNDGAWFVGVRPDEPPPLGELHSREIAIEPADGDRARLGGVTIEVDCTMPQHRHGMNATPEIERLAPGRFAVRGLELFMEGEWLFTVDITEGGSTERAQWWIEPE